MVGPWSKKRKEEFQVYSWPVDTNCCLKKCYVNFTPDDVRLWRTYFHSLALASQRAMIAHYMRARRRNAEEIDRSFHLMPPGSTPSMFPTFGDKPVRVCLTYFLFFLFTTRKKIYGRKPNSIPTAAKKYRQFTQEKFIQCVVWLENLASHYLISPSSGLVHIPVPTRRCAYQWLVEDLTARNVQSIPSMTTFMSAWKSDACNKITIRKWLPFTQCTECVRLLDNLSKRPIQADEREGWVKELRTHTKLIFDLRVRYALRAEKAIEQPKNYLSISIDAADQSAYGIPYYYRRSHAQDGMTKVSVHLMGAIVHGRQPFAFTFLENIKHGTNITIECLHRIFRRIRENEGALPQVLYLQMDNTCKQNKNKYMLAWMYHLVHIGTFRAVHLHFLPVGHTHTDVDQMFSRLAVHLRSHDSKSRNELLTRLKMAFKTRMGDRVYGEHIDRAANISEFLKPFIDPHVEGVTSYQKFVIRKFEGNVVLECFPSELSNHTEGITENWSMFTRVVPPLTTHNVKPSQRRQTNPIELDAMKRGLIRARQSRFLPECDFDDIKQCIEILGSESDLPFDWDMSVYSPSTSVPRVLARIVSHESWTIGDLCLVEPHPDQIAKDQYWIAQIVGFEMLGDDHGVSVQWWTSKSKHNRDDRLAGCFSLESQNVDVIYVSCLVDKLTFTEQYHLSMNSKKKIMYHVARWPDAGFFINFVPVDV